MFVQNITKCSIQIYIEEYNLFLTDILIYKLHRGKIQLHRGTHFYLKKSFHANFFFISAFNGLQIILLAPSCCKNSKNVIKFEMGIWEVGEKIGHTDRQTNGFS